ncbi:MAG: lamin tail domain-containing protein [Acholeplasmataceae bacterium]|nr:lamin tail domain-containing protein [Acholeplasmataceae bacterium]
MIKKTLLIMLALVSMITLAACKTDEELVLPDLAGKSKQEVVNIFSSLGIIGTFEDVINVDITEGYFVSYGDGYTVGAEYEPGATITVNFALFANVLPDLTGMTQAQIYSSLSRLNVIVEIQTIETNDVEPGIFVEYGNLLDVGDVLADDAVVLVYIAEELIIPELGLIISKYFEGSDESKMIELYNTTDAAIDLSNFMLTIYRRVTTSTTEIEIPLTGTIASHETFIIANPNSKAAILSLADMTSADLYYNGREAIALTYYNGVDTDVLGTVGSGLTYANDKTFVRDISVVEGDTTFNIADWGIYAVDNYEMFGSHPVVYPETFTLEAEYLLLDYFTQAGGVVEVEFIYNNDGDTAYFTPGFEGNDRVRFIGIDTLETGSGNLAADAQQYVASLLENATTVYIQHDPTSGIRETYGRHLGLVWADGVLVNYMVVKMGYSQNNYSDEDQQLVFNGISLDQWFQNAESYAKANNLGMWA